MGSRGVEVEWLSEMLQGAFGGLCVDLVGGISAQNENSYQFYLQSFPIHLLGLPNVSPIQAHAVNLRIEGLFGFKYMLSFY